MPYTEYNNWMTPWSAYKISLFLLVPIFLCRGLQGNANSINTNSCPSFTNISHINEWSSPAACGDVQSIPDGRYFHSAAVYTRGPTNDTNADNTPRMVIFGGFNCKFTIVGETWLYYPMINSWLRPHSLEDVEPSPRFGHSMTTLCETRVLLFAGSNYYDRLYLHRRRMNDAWIFDGVTETWSQIKLSPSSQNISLHFQYTGVSIRQPDSRCICKESLFVYGLDRDISTPDDNVYTGMWELRCINDFTSTMIYEWVTRSNATRHSDVWFMKSMFSFSDYSVYLLGENTSHGFSLDLRRLDIRTMKWTSIANYINFSPIQFLLPFRLEQQDVVLGFTPTNRQFILNLTNGDITDPFSYQSTPLTVTYLSQFSAIAMGDVVLVFGGQSLYGLSNSVWNLTVSNYRVSWTLNTYPETKPPARVVTQGNGAVVGDSFYLFGGTIDVTTDTSRLPLQLSIPNDVWQLNLRSRVWVHSWNYFMPSPRMLAALTVVDDSVMILFGGGVYKSSQMQLADNDVWAYLTRTRRWVQYVSSSSIPARVSCTLTAMENGSLLLFGGTDPESGQVFDDLWMLNICQTDFPSTTQYCTEWHPIGHHPIRKRDTWPTSRHSHSAALVKDSMVIIGGMTGSSDEWSGDIWEYKIKTTTWIKHKKQPNFTPPPPAGIILATAIGSKFLVVRQDLSLLSYMEGGDFQQIGDDDNVLSGGVTSVYSIQMQQWSNQSEGPKFGVGIMATYQDKVILIGRIAYKHYDKTTCNTDMLLSTITPRCKEGHSSSYWPQYDCKACLKGNYAPVATRQCIACPAGRTTNKTGSTAVSDCVCEDEYCHGTDHGSCHVFSSRERYMPM